MRRNDWSLLVDAQTDFGFEIASLRAAIGRAAAGVDKALNDHSSASDDDYPRWGGAEHRELSRQLDSLHDHVTRAPCRSQDQLDLRAEFATLLYFAKILRADAEAWRAGLRDGLRELERAQAAARAERERLAAEHERLLRRRDALQSRIDQTAGRLAQQGGGDCRRTLPVFRLGEALTVCSIAVLSPRRWFRFRQHWLVTLDDSRDEVRIKRC